MFEYCSRVTIYHETDVRLKNFDKCRELRTKSVPRLLSQERVSRSSKFFLDFRLSPNLAPMKNSPDRRSFVSATTKREREREREKRKKERKVLFHQTQSTSIRKHLVSPRRGTLKRLPLFKRVYR